MRLRSLLSSLPRCTCSLAPHPAGPSPRLRKKILCRPSSSSAKGKEPAVDKLIQAARSAIAASSDQDSNKQRKEYQELSRALQDVLEGEDLVGTLTTLSSTDPDPELRDLALSDLPLASTTLLSLRTTLTSLLLPAPPSNSLSALLELKAGVGGNEASLFAASLVRMYTRLAVRKGWNASLVETVAVPGVGMGTGEAVKEAILEIRGEGVFGALRREAGVHRVQRVPATETQGRVHTSTVGVVVLPSEDNPPKQEDDLFEQKDVKVEVMRSRGAGGQHVNKTESAIRLTHIPTGITVSMQDSRSQHENRSKAYRVLRSRLLDRRLSLEVIERRSARRDQVKGVDRSDKIRTYNFPQDRVTDHRVGVTLSGVEGVMEGGEGLDYITSELERREEEETLEALIEEGGGGATS